MQIIDTVKNDVKIKLIINFFIMNSINRLSLGNIIFAIIICSGLFISLLGANNNPQSKTQTTYEKVVESGTIKVGYIPYAPSFIIDPNTGEYSGTFYEVLEEIGAKLDIEIDYAQELGWGTMIESVKSGQVDLIVTGIWPTTERAKHVDFVDPLYYSTAKAYVRVDDNRFDGDLTRVNHSSIKIASIDGEITTTIAKADFPYATLVSLTQSSDVSQLLLDVASHKADITFLEPAAALEYMSNNPGQIKEVADVNPLRVYPNSMVVGKGQVELLSTLNTAIAELHNNGFVKRVIKKYEKYPNSFQSVALPFGSQ